MARMTGASLMASGRVPKINDIFFIWGGGCGSFKLVVDALRLTPLRLENDLVMGPAGVRRDLACWIAGHQQRAD